MQNKKPIRGVVTTAEDLEAGNVEHIVRVFTEVAQVPKHAKEVRSSVALEFPSYADDPRPDHTIPAIRQFIRALDAQMPYFLYFLVDNPAFRHMQFYLFCLVDRENENEQTVSAQAFVDLLERKSKDIRQFCYRIADHPDDILEALLISLPSPMLTQEPALTRRTLRSMQEILEAIARRLGGEDPVSEAPNLIPEQSAQVVNDILQQAASLAGLDRDAYESNLELVRAILATMEADSDV
jgi:hypothetical protein